MKFVFTEKKVDLAPSTRQYAEKKIGKLDRFFKTDATADVTFSMEKERCIVELTVRSGSMIFRAEECVNNEMRAAVDQAVASVVRQIRKNKTRLEKRLRQGAFERDKMMAPEFETQEEVQEEKEFPVVRTKRFFLKPMTVEEAILQMNLLDHTFFVFRNEESDGAFSVVYTRKNGGYGLIEDEI
ncbi:MAG: ribosome-associated translation inhibitor RaiA [Oscillospiraceae bacterium]|nr:ribosome-associated translation inhibitor RaiA [Oscillospiraceae bacterium]